MAAVGDAEKRGPETCSPQPYLKMNSEMVKYVFGKECHRYIREVRRRTWADDVIERVTKAQLIVCVVGVLDQRVLVLLQAVMALKEVTHPPQFVCVEDMLIVCSFCNEKFSMHAIKNIMVRDVTRHQKQHHA